VEDLAEAHALALSPAGEDQVFNLEGQEQVSVRALAEAVLEVVGGDGRVEFLEGRPGDFAGKLVTADKARDMLGWSPRITFREGVRRYVDWHLHDRARHRPVET
jgi:UDP-glucose 4-epimerase